MKSSGSCHAAKWLPRSRPAPEPSYVELESIDGVVVLAQRHLVDILEGATLREAGPPWNRHPAISLARLEEWIDFLDLHPIRRR
jgi:hypothetical protein